MTTNEHAYQLAKIAFRLMDTDGVADRKALTSAEIEAYMQRAMALHSVEGAPV